eukprot:8799873-Pyramimonas_sp.AAC.1
MRVLTILDEAQCKNFYYQALLDRSMIDCEVICDRPGYLPFSPSTSRSGVEMLALGLYLIRGDNV